MTKEFERDSRLPVSAISAGIVIGCAVTWYAVRHTLGMCGLASFGRGGEEATALFRTAGWTIPMSTMIAAGLAFLARVVRSKDDVNGLGYVVGMTKLMMAMSLAIGLSSAAGFAVDRFVSHSCDPIPFLGGWRVCQMVNIAGLLVLIPTGMLLAEYAQRKVRTARTWLGRGVVCAVVATICLAGQCLPRLVWIGMIPNAEEVEEDDPPEESPFDNYRLTADEPWKLKA